MVECSKPSCCQNDSHKAPRHFILKTVLVILGLTLVMLGVLPSVLSTDFGRQNIVKPLVSRYLHSDLEIGQLNLSWFGSQTLSNVTLKNPQNNLDVTVHSLSTETPLWKFITSAHEAGRTTLVGFNASYQTPDNQKLEISNLNAELNIDPRKNILLVQANGDVIQNGQRGRIVIDTSSKVTGKDLLRTTEINLNQFNIKVDVTDLPVEILDLIVSRFQPNLRGILPVAIGKTINIHIAEMPVSTPTYHITANSQNLQIDLVGNFVNNRFLLSQPGNVVLKFTQEVLKISPYGRFIILKPNAQAALTINELNTTLDKLSYDEWMKDLTLNSELTFSQVGLLGDVNLNNTSFVITTKPGDTQFHIQAKTGIGKNKTAIPLNALFNFSSDLKKIFNSTVEAGPIPYAFVDQFVHTSGITEQVLGDLFKIKIDFEGSLENLTATVHLQSSKQPIPPFKIQINDHVTLVSPLNIEFNASQLVNSSGKASAIQDLKGLKLLVNEFTVPLSENMFSEMRSKGGITLTHMAVQDKMGQTVASLDNLRSEWDVDGRQNKMTYSLSGKTRLGKSNEAGVLSAAGQISDWIAEGSIDLKNLKFKTQIQAKNIPTAILQTVTNFEGLEYLLGPSILVNADIDLQLPDINNKVELTVSSQLLKMNAQLKIGNSIELKNPDQPIVLEWSLTPQGYFLLRQHLTNLTGNNKDTLQVNTPTMLIAKISELNIPLTKEGWRQSSAVFDLVLGKMTLVNANGTPKYSLDNAIAKIQTKDLSKQASFTFNAHGSPSQGKSSSFDLTASGILETPLNIAAGIPPSIIADVKTTELPADLICYLICFGDNTAQHLEALIGSKVNADINVHFQNYNGPINAHIFGKNGKLDIHGQLTDGFLTLNRPLQAQVNVTPQFSKSIVQQFMPMLKDVVGADGPVTITIPHDNFYIPLKNWDFNQVSIRRAAIDLGRLYFSNKGQIGDMLSVLNYKGDNKPITIWFTPLYVSLYQGTANIERMDMLVTSYYPMAIWGKIFFKEDNVRMTFGMSGKALANAFGVKAPNDYILLLPIRGKIADASIDKKKATAKISSLVMHNSGPQGILIGTVIDVLGGGSNDSDSAPPPTTNPLPWADNVPSTQMAMESDTPLLLKPVKTISDGAQSLINSIFN